MKSKILPLVESSLLVAAAFVLSWIRIIHLPQGGSVTAVSMLPLLIVGIRRGPYWGVSAGALYGVLQLMQEGGLASPAQTLGSLAAELALDYLLAFGVLGLSALFRRMKYGLVYSVPVCLGLRLLCHVVSGVVIWAPYFAPAGMNFWWYSIAYNGSYMGVEIIFTAIVAFALVKAAPSLVTAQDTN